MDLEGQPRAVIRAAQKHLRETNRHASGVLVPVPRDEWPADVGGAGVLGVWRSSRFLATLYQERLGVMRLSVLRTLLADDGQWVDGITWDELQAVKRQCGFGDYDAIEIYPRDGDVVNVVNMRHLWVLPDACPLAWRRAP